MFPPLAQVHLLYRGPGPLSFRSGWVVCGGALLATLGRLLCKRRLRILPLNRAPVVRLLVFPATTAVKLFPRDRAFARQVGAPAPGRISAVTLRVSETLAVLALQWASWSHVQLHQHSKASEFGE
jgi:hypothetical protein